MDPRKAFALNREEKASALWKKLMAYWEDQRDLLRSQLEADLGESETAVLRGRIKQIRACLRLNEDPPTTD